MNSTQKFLEWALLGILAPFWLLFGVILSPFALLGWALDKWMHIADETPRSWLSRPLPPPPPSPRTEMR
jgi:hypothetical protein